MDSMNQKTGKLSQPNCRDAWGVSLPFFLLGVLFLHSGAAIAKTPAKTRSKASTPKKKIIRTSRTASRKAPPAPVQKARVATAHPPAAEIPVVSEPAALWQGCLQANDVPQLASRLQLEENRLRSLLSAREMLPSAQGRACLPYVGLTGGERGAATALFHADTGSERSVPVSPSVLVVSRTSDSLAVIGREFRCPESARRLLAFSARDFEERRAELLAEIPEAIRWQLEVLVPRMLPEGDGFTVRVGLGHDADSDREHLHSVEIMDVGSGSLVDGAWWVERKNGPGAIVGLKGTAYERMLWLSPIQFLRKSRGAGPTTRVVRRNFAAPKGSPKGATQARTVTVRGFHLGADLMAPTGTPIHTVGDGVVSFVGRRGGYGNLVVVDHGRGYQTYYAHLSVFQAGVRKGTAVMRGEVIGRVGATGRATAPHLHFETRKDSRYIDPYDETRQLEFWMLSAEEHERLAMRVLAGAPAVQTSGLAATSGGVE